MAARASARRVRSQLRQHAQGLGLVGEGRDAARAERRRHAVPTRAATTTRLAARGLEGRGVGREGLHVVARARHRDVDEEQVGRRIARQHGQHAAEEAAVRQQRGRDIDRVEVAVAKPGSRAATSRRVSAESGASGRPKASEASAPITQLAPELLTTTSRRPSGRQPLR